MLSQNIDLYHQYKTEHKFSLLQFKENLIDSILVQQLKYFILENL